MTEAMQGIALPNSQRVAIKSGAGVLIRPNEALRNLLLKDTGLSLSKLARKCSLTPGHLSRILNGKRNIGVKTLRRLEQAGLPVHLLLNRCLSCGQELPVRQNRPENASDTLLQPESSAGGGA